MKSLITRFASIGTIFSLVLAGLSATTPAQILGPSASVHVHKGAISVFNETIVKVTAICSGGGLGSLSVEVIQTADQSSNGLATDAKGFETVKCNGQSQDVAVTPPGFTYNIGGATAIVMLMDASAVTVASTTRPIVLRFPVIEGMEEEQGGND
ncbi:MAG: hypothetical protein E6K32_04970 [Gammaproteobacteria bacterium]|nr:MAG: hypothetical protein E6K32_04970 [Gammaproteobacteria bacterium]